MKRLTKEEALHLIKHADLKELGRMATARKKELHPDGVTTFVVDRNINYTNICWVDCKFCAFYRHEKDADAYVLTFDEIDAKIDELLEIGGTQILFQGECIRNSKLSGMKIWSDISIPNIPQLPFMVLSSR